MRQSEARRLVCKVLAMTLRQDLGNGSGWIYDKPDAKTTHSEGGESRNPADVARIEKAIHVEIKALDKRAGEGNRLARRTAAKGRVRK